MNENQQLRPDATFRHTARLFPALMPLLERWPAAKIRGRWSLQQIGMAGDAFLRELAAAAKLEPAPARVIRSGSITRALFWVIAGLLAVVTWNAVQNGMYLTMQNPNHDPSAGEVAYGATIPYAWYAMENAQLWGWLMVAAMALAIAVLRAGLLGQSASAWGKSARVLLLLGLLGMLATPFFGGPGMPQPRSWPAATGQACVLAAGVLLTMELLLTVRGRPMDAASIFLLLAAQWMLVWLAAAVSMQWRFGDQSMWDAEAVRLLTLLPTLGLGVHLAMALCARILPGALGLKLIRQRALLLGILFYEMGMIALMLWPGLLARLGSAATAVMGLRAVIFGIAVPLGLLLFVVGLDFLRGRLSGPGGITLRLAFLWLFAGAVLAGSDSLWQFSAQGGVPHSIVALYRHLLTAGFFGSLVVGLATLLTRSFLPQAWRAEAAATLACALWTAGVLVHAMAEITVLMGETHVLWVLALGATMELAAALLLAIITYRSFRLSRRPSTEINGATPLQAAINASPAAELALESAGIELLKDQSSVPPVTLGTVAYAWGWDLTRLLQRLAPPASASADKQ